MAVKKYQPISCVFYDLIEHYATLRKAVTIQYLKELGKEEILTIKAKILDTKIIDKVEHVIIEGLEDPIRMDRLISIEGEVLANYNKC